MRVLGVPVLTPQALVEHAVSGTEASVRAVRGATGQIDRLLNIGEEIVLMGHQLIDLGQRLDARAGELTALGERLDARADGLIALGNRLDGRADGILELGSEITGLGDRIDLRAGEIVNRADNLVETGNNLIVALPTLERALDLATPLEGAIDRVGRFVDRLPGGATNRRRGPGDLSAHGGPSTHQSSSRHESSTTQESSSMQGGSGTHGGSSPDMPGSLENDPTGQAHQAGRSSPGAQNDRSP